VQTNTAPLLGTTLTADPDTDGVPCTDPSVTNGCDSVYGVRIDTGTWFMGADFGYQPLGVLGDTVWFDVNTNGIRDVGEYGIPYITVELWTNGTLIATNVTDSDGYYIFGGLDDATYRVVVSTNDTDWPAEVIRVYDPDGTLDDQASSIVVSNGHIATIGGITYTNDLDVDFGYRYDGSNLLSGTVGLDFEPYDGALGDGAISGVTSNEAPFPDVTMYLYLWQDNGNTNVDSGETILIASTTTSTNGDYSFSGLPSGGVSNYYIVSLVAPVGGLTLTTINASTPSLWITPTAESDGTSRSAYQVLTVQPLTTNIDFAFRLGGKWDFGDLPDTYSTTLQATPQGARHKQSNTPNLYLGAEADTENNGQPTPFVNGDDLDAVPNDEDGVAAEGIWQDGTTGGVVSVTVGAGSGWLLGWMDFDESGDFTGQNELIIDQAASAAGSPYSIAFDIPTGTVSATTSTVLNARFRLFPARPSVPEIAYSGKADNGEVEDYRFALIPTLVVLSSFTATIEEGIVVVRWETAAEMGSVGFFVERLTDAGWTRIHADLIPAILGSGSAIATYAVEDPAAPITGTVTYRLREIENTGKHNLYGPFSFLFDGQISFTQWMIQRLGASVDPDADSDGDGMSNREEFVAGTDPENRDSSLRITSIDKTAEGIVLRWFSVQARNYRVNGSRNLNSIQDESANIPSTPPVNVYTDHVEKAESLMYRIGVDF